VVLDAINVKVRDGQVANRPVYAAIGVDLEGQKDILGMWFGDGVGKVLDGSADRAAQPRCG
jgi:putative transposase